MAFKQARCVKYENIRDDSGNDIAILIGGLIEDDSTTATRYAEYLIQGEEFNELPPADPELDGTPLDIRFQAIQLILAKFVTEQYRLWERDLKAQERVAKKPLEILNMLPPMTQLLPETETEPSMEPDEEAPPIPPAPETLSTEA